MSTGLVRESTAIEYPEDDGLPMSDNTVQWRWIVNIKENLEIVFLDDPNVFIAGNLLWYPVEGDNTIRQAPDVLAAFGRPKGDRGSYRQWEEGGIAPQVVFEILSPSNRGGAMDRKFVFYEQHGVEEYYIYDPERIELTGWLRSGNKLREIPKMNGWVSPRLGIRFVLEADDMTVFGPKGNKFVLPSEIARQAQEQADLIERLKAQLQALGAKPAE